MSIRDRGLIKWQGFMMPEHNELLRKLARDELRQAKPVLDEYQIAEFEAQVHYAMEYNLAIRLDVYRDGFTDRVEGRAHYLDAIKKEIRLVTEEETVECIAWADVVRVEVID